MAGPNNQASFPAAATALDKDPKALSQIVNITTDTLFTKRALHKCPCCCPRCSSPRTHLANTLKNKDGGVKNTAAERQSLNYAKVSFTKGLDKKYEFDADKYGVAYAAAAGYNPRGLPEFLERLRKEEGKVIMRY
jgi:hypothetical protein